MNQRFFQLPEEKQRRILSAGYKVFSENSYKKAPMSEIAAAGDVSKPLLFHYFGNKRELYLFLWSHGITETRKVLSSYKVTETTDFFEMLRRSLLAKCSVLRTSPYLYTFLHKAYYEQDTEVKAGVQSAFQEVSGYSEAVIWRKIDFSKFRKDIDLKLMYREILLAADGYMRQMLTKGKMDAEQMEQDFMELIAQWKTVYLK